MWFTRLREPTAPQGRGGLAPSGCCPGDSVPVNPVTSRAAAGGEPPPARTPAWPSLPGDRVSAATTAVPAGTTRGRPAVNTVRRRELAAASRCNRSTSPAKGLERPG